MDIFSKLKQEDSPLGKYYRVAHGYFMFPELEGEIKNKMNFKGKECIIWSLDNYLGLANHPEVRVADSKASADFGLAYPMGERMMSGQTKYHEKLEKQLAKFVSKEDSYLLNSGYQGMISVIDSLVDRKDVIVYDSEVHACIIDGMRLHFGKRFVFPNNDMEKLDRELQKAKKITSESGGGILVITAGVFGMTGDLGKLNEIAELKKKFNFRLLVDDSHGFGIMGENGAGTGEHFLVQNDIDLYFGSFSIAMSGYGAFIAGNKDIIDYLRYNMRSQVFGKAIPQAMTIGIMKRIEVLENQPQIREKLWKIVHKLQKGLREIGFNIGNTKSPVTPIYLDGDIPEATNLIYDLRENYNIFCSMVIYPVVPKGVILIRLNPTANHTVEDVQYTIDKFSIIKQKLLEGKYRTGKFPEVNS